MAVLELTLEPVGTETGSISSYVARTYELVKNMEGIRVESHGNSIRGRYGPFV